MKIVVCTILCLLASGCCESQGEHVADGVRRIETKDAVCYLYYGHSISCLPKRSK